MARPEADEPERPGQRLGRTRSRSRGADDIGRFEPPRKLDAKLRLRDANVARPHATTRRGFVLTNVTVVR
jgi:hypothetical protein